jgi:hypothetical protein
MKLHIHPEGDKDAIPTAKQAWDTFAKSVAVPFVYEQPVLFSPCAGMNVSAFAEARLSGGVAHVNVSRSFLNATCDEQQLTLLDELLHIAAFVGRLRDMHEAVEKLRETYHYAFPPAFALANWMFEVDAECALRDRYSKHAKRRADYYVKLLVQDIRSNDNLPEGWAPYYWLRYYLCAELAGILTRDHRIEALLFASLHARPEAPSHAEWKELDPLHRMLSPKFNGYYSLPQWGAPRYEAILNRVIDRLQRVRE